MAMVILSTNSLLIYESERPKCYIAIVYIPGECMLYSPAESVQEQTLTLTILVMDVLVKPGVTFRRFHHPDLYGPF